MDFLIIIILYSSQQKRIQATFHFVFKRFVLINNHKSLLYLKKEVLLKRDLEPAIESKHLLRCCSIL